MRRTGICLVVTICALLASCGGGEDLPGDAQPRVDHDDAAKPGCPRLGHLQYHDDATGLLQYHDRHP